MIPIYDPGIPPNEYYTSSPLLFWMIIVTGSRRYRKDPMLLESLRPHIYNLCFFAIQSHAPPIPTIKALLLLCLWPLPVNSIFKDINPILGGAAMHLGVLAGLHVSGAGHEFLEDRIFPDPAEREARAKLWLYVQIGSQL